MCLYIQPALKQLSLWNKSIHASSHIVTSYILDVQQNMKNIKPMLNTFPQLVFGRWWELSEMGPSENSLDIWTLFQKETMKVWSLLPLLFSLPSYEVSSFVLPSVPHHYPLAAQQGSWKQWLTWWYTGISQTMTQKNPFFFKLLISSVCYKDGKLGDIYSFFLPGPRVNAIIWGNA